MRDLLAVVGWMFSAIAVGLFGAAVVYVLFVTILWLGGLL